MIKKSHVNNIKKVSSLSFSSLQGEILENHSHLSPSISHKALSTLLWCPWDLEAMFIWDPLTDGTLLFMKLWYIDHDNTAIFFVKGLLMLQPKKFFNASRFACVWLGLIFRRSKFLLRSEVISQEIVRWETPFIIPLMVNSSI